MIRYRSTNLSLEAARLTNFRKRNRQALTDDRSQQLPATVASINVGRFRIRQNNVIARSKRQQTLPVWVIVLHYNLPASEFLEGFVLQRTVLDRNQTSTHDILSSD